jgi:twitching motility two-component system response regulator PilH
MAEILVIDDSSFLRRIVKSELQSKGHVVREAPNGKAGLEGARSERPDCMLLDLAMPELGGLEVLDALREEDPSMPVVVVTADIQETTRQECLRRGATAVINKPVKPGPLCEAVDRALAGREEART